MTQGRPLISVVLATYNGARYLEEQLGSVVKQRFTDFEIILVDDASTDHSVKLAETFLKESGFGNYSIRVNPVNLGLNKTFQRGAEACNGKYIAFCDQDDIWRPEKLETLLGLIRDKRASVAYSPSITLRIDGTPGGLLVKPGLYRNHFKRFLCNRARGASMLIESDYLKRVLPFSDYDLYDKWIIFKALAEGSVVFTPEPLDYYRIHAGNVVGTRFKFRSRENLHRKLSDMALFYRDIADSLKPGNPNLPTINELVLFHELLVQTLEKRNFRRSLSVYFTYVLRNGLAINDNLVYFCYLFLR